SSHVTQPQPSTTPSLPEQVLKPRKRWPIALGRTIAVLAAVILVGSTLFLFNTHTKQQTRGNSTNTGVQKTPLEGIVVAASTQHLTIGDDITLTARDVNTGALLWQNSALGKLDSSVPVGLASADQTVYVAYHKQVWAFQVSNGKQLWQQT